MMVGVGEAKFIQHGDLKGFHLFGFGGHLVIMTEEVQDAMNN